MPKFTAGGKQLEGSRVSVTAADKSKLSVRTGGINVSRGTNIGAGISFALDKVVKPTGSSVAVSSAQVVRLEEENKAIKAELAELKAAIKAMQKQK